ncbi:GNAT family N-acetyltransferase [Alkalibacillus haloalkaliphilus]|uniref:Putative N-acetyltransferase YbbJ n=1 Tax=Alkalibacillus haloalkaliphilus TaxID=94136 RepID=A0A511W4Z9_9BACI|nr:GNAT family protein [Alkalibacillus haloalkaliphilus]GEN46155.1 putative N-acetyltransferase YbbJ [Alkalibacillus haloalkaliphilus]
MMINLEHYSEEHLQALNEINLPEDQAKFTTLPHQLTEVSEGQHRVVIVAKDRPIGFFLLNNTERVKTFTDNPNALLLSSLSIDEKEQEKGYAKQAMLLIKDFVHNEFPNCNEIVLAVNHQNIAAQKLYFNVGYYDTGRRVDGPVGEQWVMSLAL